MGSTTVFEAKQVFRYVANGFTVCVLPDLPLACTHSPMTSVFSLIAEHQICALPTSDDAIAATAAAATQAEARREADQAGGAA